MSGNSSSSNPKKIAISTNSTRHPRLPKNQAAIDLNNELEKHSYEQEAGKKDTEKEAKARYMNALGERRLRSAEKKIVRELGQIDGLEHMIMLENVRTHSRNNVLKRTYLVEPKYDKKQKELNQMFIDDRLHPRYSQPKPMQMPNLHGTPNNSDDEK